MAICVVLGREQIPLLFFGSGAVLTATDQLTVVAPDTDAAPPHRPEPPSTRRPARGLAAHVPFVVVALLLAFLLDTSRMHMDAARGIMTFSFMYSIPLVLVEPYRRWRLFQTSTGTTLLDSIVIAAFIGATGGSQSPFFPLYLLAAAAVAMRFEMKQAVMTCLVYAFMYAVAYFITWDGSADEMGRLLMHIAYMLLIGVGVGQLAREENARAQQVEQVERLNAENARLLSRNVRAARIDKLTGLLNRGFLEKAAQREVRHAKATSGYLSVLFCDLDHLKRVNDHLVAAAAYPVLKGQGELLPTRVRENE